MNTEKSVRQIAEEWNAKAKAEGRLLEGDPWALPDLYQGSVLDIPLTPEAEERIRRLDALIARLEQEKAAAVAKEQQDAPDRIQPITERPSMPATNTEAPTNKAS